MTSISVRPLRPSARSNQSCKEPLGQAIIGEDESMQACLRSVHKMVMEGRFDLLRQCTANWIKSYRVDGLPLSGLKLSDWLLLPIVEEVLDEPDSVSLTMQHIADELEPFVADAVQEWYKERREELLSQLSKIRSLSDMSKDFDLLQLAVHTFDCASCHERFMPFPDVIVHRCCHVPYVRGRGQKDSYTSLVNGYLGRQLDQPVAWSPDRVRVSTRLYPAKANALIQKLGFRPDTATHYDMERQRKRVVCDECSEKVERGRPRCRKYEIFDFKRALFHQDSERHIDSDSPCTWKIMPMEVSERVWEFERDAEAMNEPHYRRVKKYTCCPCGACFWHHKAELLEHLRSKHDIEEAQARHDIDYHEQVTVVKISDGSQLEDRKSTSMSNRRS